MDILILILILVAAGLSLYMTFNPKGRNFTQAAFVLSLVRSAVISVEQATKGADFQNQPRDVKNKLRLAMCHTAIEKLAAAYGIKLNAVLWQAIDVMIETEVNQLPETRSSTVNTLANWLDGVTHTSVTPRSHVTPPSDTTHPK